MGAVTTADPAELHAGPEAGDRAQAGRAVAWARICFGVAAAVLIVLAARLPVWEARLSAPQYPAGLVLTAYGNGDVLGDMREINELNHYVGMKVFSTSDVPETVLWLPSIGLAIGGVIIATVSKRRWLRRLAMVGLWLVPICALADVQYRLYLYGHSVQSDAAIRVEPFVPLVIGPTKVLNFTTLAFPGLGVALLVAAAAAISVGPLVIGRLTRHPAQKPSETTSETASS